MYIYGNPPNFYKLAKALQTPIVASKNEGGEDPPKMSALKRFGRGWAGLAAPGLAATPFGMGASRGFVDNSIKNETSENLLNRTNNMAKQMGVRENIDIIENPSPAFAPSKAHMAGGRQNPAVRAPKGISEGVLAHELGHARNYQNMSKLQKDLTLGARGLGGVASQVSGAWAAGQDNPSYTPGLVAAGANLPTLIDEGMATGRAFKHLRNTTGSWGKALSKGKHLIPAFGSYAAMAGAPLGITALRKAYNDNYSSNPS